MSSTLWLLILLVPTAAAALIMWVRSDAIVWWEASLGVVTAAAVAAAVMFAFAWAESYDREVWSGHAYLARHTPRWRAEWTETETYRDRDGNRRTRTVQKSRNYPPEWWLETTIGRVDISEGTWDSMSSRHGVDSEAGHRPHFASGDRLDYSSRVDGRSSRVPLYPVHVMVSWSNPLKGTDSIKLGRPISDEEAAGLGLFRYPSCGNPLRSGRVMGGAPVDPYRWDQMMALLGPEMKVNLILINFGGRGMQAAVDQRDYWRNGRKNDLVLCYGEGWSYVFGWSESSLVKEELQDVLLSHPVGDGILPLLEEEVRDHFQRYEWGKHEGTPRHVKTSAIAVAFALVCLTQVALYWWFHNNSISK